MGERRWTIHSTHPAATQHPPKPDCTNCDGRGCMGCVFRTYDHDCADDCPECCADNFESTSIEVVSVSDHQEALAKEREKTKRVEDEAVDFEVFAAKQINELSGDRADHQALRDSIENECELLDDLCRVSMSLKEDAAADLYANVSDRLLALLSQSGEGE